MTQPNQQLYYYTHSDSNNDSVPEPLNMATRASFAHCYQPEVSNETTTATTPSGSVSVPTSLHQMPTILQCPRCSNSYSEGAHWCQACGELLLGASVCSTDWNTKPAMFQPVHMASTELIQSSGVWRGSESLPLQSEIFTYNAVSENLTGTSDHADYPYHQVASCSAVNPTRTTVYAATANFPTAFGETQSDRVAQVPTTTSSQQFNETYHFTEASFPPCDVEVESLQSKFDKLQVHVRSPFVQTGGYERASFGTNMRRGCRRTTSCRYMFQDDNGQFQQQTSGLSADLNMNEDVNSHSGRQRCISGPMEMPMFATKYEYPPNFYSFHSTPSMYHHLLESNNSRISSASYSHQFQSSVPESIDSHSCLTERNNEPSGSNPFGTNNTDAGFSLATPITTDSNYATRQTFVQQPKRNQRQRGGRLNSYRARRKHPSECTTHRGLMPSDNGVPVASNQAGGSRLRSCSTGVYPHDKPAIQLDRQVKQNEPRCNWQSSRIAWSAHDPSLLKKKSSNYLRASFSQGPSSSQSITDGHKMNSVEGAKSNYGTHALPTQAGDLMSNGNHAWERGHTRSAARGTKSRKSARMRTKPAVEARVAGPVAVEQTNEPRQSPSLDSDSIEPNESNWLRLPDELWLAVLHLLTPADRARTARVCRRLAVLVADRSLWRVVQLHRYPQLSNSILHSMGRFRPREFRLTYCHGEGVTADGLRHLFKTWGPCLRKFSFTGCTKGIFDCDMTLLLAAKHCPNLSHINASYTQAVRDVTVIVLARSALHFVSVKLNGAQQISNAAIHQLVHYHKDTLQTLELFGCFRLNSDIFALLGRCQELRALAFGHLHHLSSDGLLELVGKLPHLSSLDLRGTHTMASDSNLVCLADKCPFLEEVVLANIQSLKHEDGIAQMLRRLPRLRVLDLCGLAAVGDLTMEALSTCCPQLEELDVSCTSVTYIGLSNLARVPTSCLRSLRISCCRDITREVLEKLVRTCSKLTRLYAYGFTSIKDWGFLQIIRPTLIIESEA